MGGACRLNACFALFWLGRCETNPPSPCTDSAPTNPTASNCAELNCSGLLRDLCTQQSDVAVQVRRQCCASCARVQKMPTFGECAPSPTSTQPTVTLPTTSPPASLFAVTSVEAANCRTIQIAEQSCITNIPASGGTYGDGERCTFQVLQNMTLALIVFETERDFDELTISGEPRPFSGSLPPSCPPGGMRVAFGTTISWSSDYSNGGAGFAICNGGRPAEGPMCSRSCFDPSLTGAVNYGSAGSFYQCAGNQLGNVGAFRSPFQSLTAAIDLTDNGITYVPRTAFGNLTNLADLNLGFNQITLIQGGSFENCEKLLGLNITNNWLSQLPPDLLTPCTLLIDLALQENRLTQFDQVSLGDLSVSVEIIVSHNALSTLASAALTKSTQLVQLDMSFNELTWLDPTCFASVSATLKYLFLDHNALTYIDGRLFTACDILEQLTLEYNSISMIEHGAFSSLQSLKVLLMSKNPLGASFSTDQAVFGATSQLVNLSLTYCQLTSLSFAIAVLPDMSVALLNDNNFQYINYDVFVNRAALSVLVLSDNMITAIVPGSFSGTSNLATLLLNGNRLTSFNAGEWGLGTLLRNLDVSANQITGSITADMLEAIPGVAGLSLANNQIASLGPLAFAHQTAMSILSLYSNRLTSVSDLAFANASDSLAVLQLSYNPITTIGSRAFASVTRLQKLLLGSTSLATVPTQAIRLVPALKALLLSNNTLSVLSNLSFYGCCSQLTQLYICCNRITSIEAGTFVNMTFLTVITLNQNRLTSLPSSLFMTARLRSLYAERNQITSLDEAWGTQTALEQIYLYSNILTAFNTGIFTALANLDELYIAPNPIVCTNLERNVCTQCQFGYVFNSSLDVCVLPTFAPAIPIHSNASSPFGTPTDPAVLYIGESYSETAPPLVPKESAFVGYTGSFENIHYRLDVDGDRGINISCGDIVSGNTATDPHAFNLYQVRNTNFSYNPADEGYSANQRYLFANREARYTFRVTSAGANITFDTCLSDIPMTIAVYRLLSDDPNNLNSMVRIFPLTNRTVTTMRYANEADLTVTANFPAAGGCGKFSPSSKVTGLVITEPGEYSVVVEGSLSFPSAFDPSRADGQYVLSMTCSCFDTSAGLVSPPPGCQFFESINNSCITSRSVLSDNECRMASSILGIPTAILAVQDRNQSNATCVVNRGARSHAVCAAFNPTSSIYTRSASACKCRGGADVVDQQYIPLSTRLGLSVNTKTGLVSGQPRLSGNFSFNLSAVDESGAVATIKQWRCIVLDRPQFERTTVPFTYNPPLNSPRSPLVKGRLYNFVEPDIAKGLLFQGYPPGSASKITYRLVDTGNTNLGQGAALIDSSTGYIQTVVNVIGNYTLHLEALDSGGRSASVFNWSFTVLPADSTVPEYGPNGHGCSHGRAVDLIAFDRHFNCNCSGTLYTGPNCDRPLPSSNIDSVRDDTLVATTVGSVVSFVVLVAGYIYVKLLKQRRLRKPVDFSELKLDILDAVASEQMLDAVSHRSAAPLEIPRKTLSMLELLGAGNFGKVHKALYIFRDAINGSERRVEVAVKCLNESSSDTAQNQFLAEALITHQFEHPNVCGMWGVVTTGDPFMIVLEYCSKGSLKDILRKHGINTAITDLLQMLSDIASGMEYLSAASFVHRDLATRNVLCDAAQQCKVCDFGLSRSTNEADYYRSDNVAFELPLRWTDPSVFDAGRFNQATDVWSFGVTAIEVFTCAETPYRGWLTEYVIERVRSGYRLPRPSRCPKNIYELCIEPCWAADLGSRPTFTTLTERLKSLTNSGTNGMLDLAISDESALRFTDLTFPDSPPRPPSIFNADPEYLNPHGESRRSLKDSENKSDSNSYSDQSLRSAESKSDPNDHSGQSRSSGSGPSVKEEWPGRIDSAYEDECDDVPLLSTRESAL